MRAMAERLPEQPLGNPPDPLSEAPRPRLDAALLSLIAKYDRPGPRYTSYPTAPHFRDDFGAADHARLLARTAAAGRPLSLYVHLPFCAHRCLFCGCNVQVSQDRSRAGRYLDAVEREVERAADLLGEGAGPVTQVHWGGGTPTYLSASELARLMAILRRRFRFAAEVEIGVEVDPRECSPAQLDALAAAGVNRISLGVQDLDPKVQRAIRRLQGPELVRAVVEGARRRGVESLNVDLVYGLPHQTAETFAATVREVLAMAPDRIAVFNFAYLPEVIRHQRALDPAALPGPAERLAILGETIATLTGAGYLVLGMDHFARPGDPLARALAAGTMTRNFQGYSTGGETDLLAFGASAISATREGYAQNLRAVAEYGEAVAAGGLATTRGIVLSHEDRLRRDVIMALMSRFALDKWEIEAAHGIDFDRHFAAELEALAPLADDGLVELSADRIAVTSTGRLLVRNVAMAFDAYLGADVARYSRTV